MRYLLSVILLMFLFSCTSPMAIYKKSYEPYIVKVNEDNKQLVEQWKQSGVKIIDIDTIKTRQGIVYKLKISY